MTQKYITLRTFSANELILDDEQTRNVLKFFFPSDIDKIDQCPVTNNTKSLAQGLLVEAIDATYKLGFIQGLWETFINPAKYPNNIVKLIKKFAIKALKHWFKHATANDLHNVKIYELVRATLSRNFRSYLNIEILAQIETRVIFTAFINESEFRAA